MLNPSKEYLEEQKKLITLHSARFCWRNRYKPCPKGGTWGEWFERMYKISLDEYARQRKLEQIQQQDRVGQGIWKSRKLESGEDGEKTGG